MDAVTIAGLSAAAGTVGTLVTGAVTDADSVGATIVQSTANVVQRARSVVTPRMPTVAQIETWERKVGRPASKRAGIQVRPRVHTYPYLRTLAHKLQEFAAMASRALNLTPAGGTLWAVKANIEGGYDSGGAWNRNTGNVKLYRSLALADVTPECWFLIDNINSYDMYQSFGVNVGDTADQFIDDNPSAWEAAARDAWARTFGQPHYQNSFATVNGQRKTFMECVNGGLLQQVCGIMGGNGYAASYRSPSFMTARYRRLVRDNRVDANLNIQSASTVIGRTAARPFSEVR